MLERIQRIDLIRKRFSEFDVFIQSSNKGGFYDINRHAEEISREILNATFGYELKNLNFSESINFPVIDLADDKNGICFQVTSNKTTSELKQLPVKFKEKKLESKYPKFCLFFLSIGNKQKIKHATQHTGLPEAQVLDFDNIIVHLQSLGSEGGEQIDKVLSLLDSNYIRYTYIEEAESNYFNACKNRFDTKFFVEPFLIEEVPNIAAPEDEWESSHLSNKILIKREVGKVKLGNLVERFKHLVITGNPGTGKSELVKDLFVSLLNQDNRYLNQKIFPIYLRLTDKSLTKIEDELKTEIKKFIPSIGITDYDKLIDELLRSHLQHGTLCLILDGYDELDLEQLKHWNEGLRVFILQNPSNRVILTVRKNRITADIHLPIQHYYDILPFDNKLVSQYVNNVAAEMCICDEKLVTQTAEKLITANTHIKEPALVIKMIVEGELSGNRNNFSSKAAIYNGYFEKLIEKLILQKGIQSVSKLGTLFEKLIRASFDTLAYISFANTFYNGNYHDLANAASRLDSVLGKVEAAAAKGYLFCKGIDFFVDELKIMQRVDNKLLFTHFTFQEFFLAVALHKRLFSFRSTAFRWIKAAYSTSKYNQVFLFLMGLLSENECKVFVNKFLKWPLRQRLQLAGLLEVFTQSKYYFLGEIACEGKLSNIRKSYITDKMLERLDAGDPLHFPKVCRILSLMEPGSEIIFGKILKALENRSHYNRREGLTIYALASVAHNPNIIELMKELLYHGDGYVRGAAILFFGRVQYFDRQIIDRAFELASIEKAYNSIDVQEMVVSLAQVSPESCVPYIESLKKENKRKHTGSKYEVWSSFIEYYGGKILNIARFKEPEYEGRILRYLDKSNIDPESKSDIARAIGKSGIRSERLIPVLIELVRNDDEVSAYSLMAFRDAFIVRPEIITEAIKLLESAIPHNRIRAMNYLAQIQYVTSVNYNGRELDLASMVADLFFKYKDEPNSPFGTYAIEYLGKVNYKSSNVETTVLESALGQRTEVFSSIETLTTYLINVNHFSLKFLGLLLSYQQIAGDFRASCFAANSYFENIERYVPEGKQRFVKNVLMDFWFKNIIIIWKLRNYLKRDEYNGMWIDQQFERLFRTGLALQKMVLSEDERRLAKKLYK